jgi:hypothetical protein
VRTVIHFFYHPDTPDEGILARFGKIYGEGIGNLKAIQPWTWKCRNGKTDLDNEPTPEQPRRNKKLPVIRTMIEENPYLSQGKIAQTLALHRDTVKRLIIEELNLRPVNFK